VKLLYIFFNLLSKIGSYAFATAFFNIFSIFAGCFFAFYYLKSGGVEISHEYARVFLISSAGGWFLHLIQFGLFSRLHFGGIGKNIKSLNKLMEFKTFLSIPDNLMPAEYSRLYSNLSRLPYSVTMASLFWFSVSLAVFRYWGLYYAGLEQSVLNNFFYAGIIALSVLAVFSVIISESMTMPARSYSAQKMIEKNIAVKAGSYSSIRFKMLVFAFLFVLLIFISNLLVYYQRDTLTMAFEFLVGGTLLTLIEGHISYYTTRISLNDVKNSMLKMRSSMAEIHFPGGLDREVLRVAEYIAEISKNLKNYRIGFDKKITQQKEDMSEVQTRVISAETQLKENLSHIQKMQKKQSFLKTIEWNGLKISGYVISASEACGDFYDYIMLPGNQFGVLLGESSGLGISKPINIANFKIYLREISKKSSYPAEIFKQLNDEIIEILNDDDYISACMFSFDEAHNLFYSNASMYPAVIYRRNEGKFEHIDADGIFIGAAEDEKKRYTQKSDSLYPGDRIILYSDGIIKLKNSLGEEFGHSRLEQLIKRFKNDSIDDCVHGMFRELEQFSEDASLSDDFSFLVIESDLKYGKFMEKTAEAIELLTQKEREKAFEIFSDAVRLYDKNANAYKNMGIVAFELEKQKESLECFEKCVELDSGNPENYFWYSTALIKNRKFKEAADAAKKAIEIKPLYIQAYNNLGIAYANLKKYEAAKLAFNKVLALDPENAEVKKSLKKVKEIMIKKL